MGLEIHKSSYDERDYQEFEELHFVNTVLDDPQNFVKSDLYIKLLPKLLFEHRIDIAILWCTINHNIGSKRTLIDKV